MVWWRGGAKQMAWQVVSPRPIGIGLTLGWLWKEIRIFGAASASAKEPYFFPESSQCQSYADWYWGYDLPRHPLGPPSPQHHLLGPPSPQQQSFVLPAAASKVVCSQTPPDPPVSPATPSTLPYCQTPEQIAQKRHAALLRRAESLFHYENPNEEVVCSQTPPDPPVSPATPSTLPYRQTPEQIAQKRHAALLRRANKVGWDDFCFPDNVFASL